MKLEPLVIICRSESEHTRGAFHCNRCGGAISISPDGCKRIVGADDYMLLCVPCARVVMGSLPEKEKLVVELSPDAQRAWDEGRGKPTDREFIQSLFRRAERDQ